MAATFAAAPAWAAEAAYQIKPGDVLSVSVWREPDLQLTVLVRPDGQISMPLAGSTRAAGETPEALEAEIAERLSTYIPDASVSVSLLEIKGNSIYVIGRVAAPGQFVMHQELDILQALSIAGGMTTFAKLNDIKVLRREGGTQIAIPFRYQDVANGQGLEQNIRLKSGDVIVVP